MGGNAASHPDNLRKGHRSCFATRWSTGGFTRPQQRRRSPAQSRAGQQVGRQHLPAAPAPALWSAECFPPSGLVGSAELGAFCERGGRQPARGIAGRPGSGRGRLLDVHGPKWGPRHWLRSSKTRCARQRWQLDSASSKQTKKTKKTHCKQGRKISFLDAPERGKETREQQLNKNIAYDNSETRQQQLPDDISKKLAITNVSWD